uniref:Uncharacterized protein n=1 Tax=Globodera rostochiensis TaxID=31243 RepID=A0A914HC62_GLORO
MFNMLTRAEYSAYARGIYEFEQPDNIQSNMSDPPKYVSPPPPPSTGHGIATAGGGNTNTVVYMTDGGIVQELRSDQCEGTRPPAHLAAVRVLRSVCVHASF